MIYSDEKILLADCQEELHQVAKRLKLGKASFHQSPVPHYALNPLAVHKLTGQNVKITSTAEMLYLYFKNQA